MYSRRDVVDHCRVDGHLRVASDCHGSGARCLQVSAGGRRFGDCGCLKAAARGRRVFVDCRRAVADHC